MCIKLNMWTYLLSYIIKYRKFQEKLIIEMLLRSRHILLCPVSYHLSLSLTIIPFALKAICLMWDHIVQDMLVLSQTIVKYLYTVYVYCGNKCYKKTYKIQCLHSGSLRCNFLQVLAIDEDISDIRHSFCQAFIGYVFQIKSIV